MDLHRHWKVQLSAPVTFAAGVLMLFSPQLLAVLGREYFLGDWVGYLIGALGVGGGILIAREHRLPFAARIDDDGISVTRSGKTVTLPWATVVRVSVDRRSGDGRFNRPAQVTVWTPDTLPDPPAADVTAPGMLGYRMLDLTELAEPRATVLGALHDCAGDRYVAPAR